ncbi:DUF2911 domain-containing protein [Fulvivirgaceae bacterium BMA10]|uniref:DUF2911 domain-containing protein n=1 Tax=Splendidivirga corallicola TaxID=3051826 RepID=A0ABT8KVE2_9BACT|nr:DUF2911 domain-containing protein [Fulvivirgaceae bacterium BMA10]
MKNPKLSIAFVLLTALCVTASDMMAQTITTPRNASPAGKVSQTVGISKVTIKYSRPSVRGREIWGKLVPYGMNNLGFGTATASPWRAGANENTTITFSHDAKIEGKDIAAGTYGLHIDVKEGGNEATLILSNNSSSWGSYFYDEKEDALRVGIKTEEIPMTETLTYNFVNMTPTSATAALDWEKKRFPFKVEFDVHDIVLANASDELRSVTGFGWQGPLSAAQYCLQNDVHLDKAMAWADQSIATQANFQNRSVKAQILAKQGKVEEGKTLMKKALDDPSANANNYYAYGRQLIGLDMDEEAMEVFEKLNKKWPDHWLAPHGLARGYSALGDYKKALKHERIALEKAPQGSKQFLQGYVETLEAGKDFN